MDDFEWYTAHKYQGPINIDTEKRDLHLRIAALEAENVALREDAERYRWLRAVDAMSGDWLPEQFWEELGNRLNEQFDAAIDAARKETNHG